MYWFVDEGVVVIVFFELVVMINYVVISGCDLICGMKVIEVFKCFV